MSEEINIRSDEVREVMEKMPSWIIRWGTSLIFAIMAIVIIGSHYFNYPTIINSKIVVTTENPPVSLVARSSGRLSQIFVSDTQRVTQGKTIAIIENPASYDDVMTLKQQLYFFNSFILSPTTKIPPSFNTALELGELQNAYTKLVKQVYDYIDFVELDYHNKKIKSLDKELAQYKNHIAKLNSQIDLLSNKVKVAKAQYERASSLHKSGTIADKDLENERNNLLDQQYNLEQAGINVSSINIEMAGLQKQKMELELAKSETTKKMNTLLQETFNNLQAELSKWELNYVLKAPTYGIITFTKIWSENQYVKEGETAFTVIPENPGKIIGKIQLPIKGSGKVKEGQEVNIKFDNYPYLEYGLVNGLIKSISLVPEGNYYVVEVSLPKGLVTFYGKKLDFNQEMQGDAEIITEKLSLLKRVLNPIKYLIEKNIGNS